MNKRLVGIITAIIVVIAIVVGVFMIKGAKDNEGPSIPDQSNSEIKQKADEISKDIPGLDAEDVEDILKEETTDGQKSAFNDATDIITIDSSATFDEEGKLHITDTEGNDVVIDEHPHQDVLDMTEEEAEEDLDRIMEELNNYINKPGQSNQNTNQNGGQSTGNTEGTTGNNTGSNQNTGHTGNVWDQEFYDSLTNDADKKQYEEASDANRIMMKQAVEEFRAQENNNNQSSGEMSAEEYMDSWSNIGHSK